MAEFVLVAGAWLGAWGAGRAGHRSPADVFAAGGTRPDPAGGRV